MAIVNGMAVGDPVPPTRRCVDGYDRGEMHAAMTDVMRAGREGAAPAGAAAMPPPPAHPPPPPPPPPPPRPPPHVGGGATIVSESATREQQQEVEGLLRSGKPALSVSESKRVADFLARHKDLLILCAGEADHPK